MSLEHIGGTHNHLATLVTLSLQVGNLTGTALDVWYEATKLLGGSTVFQEATSEPDEKIKKPTACHLMPHNKHPGK
jgi:hypothetical protein